MYKNITSYWASSNLLLLFLYILKIYNLLNFYKFFSKKKIYINTSYNIANNDIYYEKNITQRLHVFIS